MKTLKKALMTSASLLALVLFSVANIQVASAEFDPKKAS